LAVLAAAPVEACRGKRNSAQGARIVVFKFRTASSLLATHGRAGGGAGGLVQSNGPCLRGRRPLIAAGGLSSFGPEGALWVQS